MIVTIFMSIGLAMVAFGIFMLIKNENTFRCQMLITEAIGLYQRDKIAKHEFDYDVEFYDEEPYDKTLWRLWDWGYTRILPPEKFEIIKPYIPKAMEDVKKWQDLLRKN